MSTSESPITSLLERVRQGDRHASDELLPLVYDQIHRIAELSMQGERKGHTLQPTALVHEAWIRLLDGATPSLKDRGHFFRVAALAMRHVLVDHARAKQAAKRGQRAAVSPEYLEHLIGVYEHRSLDVLALHDALEELAVLDEGLAAVVELRYFAGLSIDETAEALGVSPSSVDRSWRTARAWLRTKIRGSDGHAASPRGAERPRS